MAKDLGWVSESSPSILPVIVESESAIIVAEMKSFDDGSGSSHPVELEAMELVAGDAQVPPTPFIAAEGLIELSTAGNLVHDPGF